MGATGLDGGNRVAHISLRQSWGGGRNKGSCKAGLASYGLVWITMSAHVCRLADH